MPLRLEAQDASAVMWSALHLAAFGLLIFLLDWGGVMLTREGGRVGALWLPNALLAAIIELASMAPRMKPEMARTKRKRR